MKIIYVILLIITITQNITHTATRPTRKEIVAATLTTHGLHIPALHTLIESYGCNHLDIRAEQQLKNAVSGYFKNKMNINTDLRIDSLEPRIIGLGATSELITKPCNESDMTNVFVVHIMADNFKQRLQMHFQYNAERKSMETIYGGFLALSATTLPAPFPIQKIALSQENGPVIHVCIGSENVIEWFVQEETVDESLSVVASQDENRGLAKSGSSSSSSLP